VRVELLPFLWSGLHAVKVASVYVFGALSDRLGRRPMILAGWLFYSATYVAFALVESATLLASVFLAYGLFHGLTEGAERALVARLAPGERRGAAFGIYNAAIGIAALPASLLMGSIWQSWGYAAGFGVGAALAAAAFLLLATAGRVETAT
jgi:MFS family permease